MRSIFLYIDSYVFKAYDNAFQLVVLRELVYVGFSRVLVELLCYLFLKLYFVQLLIRVAFVGRSENGSNVLNMFRGSDSCMKGLEKM